MTTGQLIDLLIKDLKPEWSFNRIILLAIGMGTLISASAFLVAVGFRADIAGAIHSWRFLLKFVLTGTLAVSTTGMLSNLGRPNGAPERWGWGAAVASAMLVCAIAVELMPQPEAKWLVRLVGHNTRICLTVIPLLSVGPLLCFFAALHTGRRERQVSPAPSRESRRAELARHSTRPIAPTTVRYSSRPGTRSRSLWSRP